MDYIVLDLEWNQSNTGLEKEVELLPFEIVEIGAVKLNKAGTIFGEFNQLVKPQVYHEMHRITSKIIHLEIEELAKGKPFYEVANTFLDWCGRNYIFCTWGPLDLYELQRNMKYYQMPSLGEGPIPFLDVQKLFSIAYEDGKQRRALEYAIDFMKIEKDIPFHRAYSDAYYTAKILAEIKEEAILKKVSYDVFNVPIDREHEIKIQFDTYMKYISREFPDKTAAFEDKEVASSKCYYCHRNLRKKIKWFSINGKHYYCVAYCEKHGYLKGKIRIHKIAHRGIFIVKTTKFISEEEAEQIVKRSKRTKESLKYKK